MSAVVPGAGAGLQPDTPDTRPGAALESGAALNLEGAHEFVAATGPKCPSCGHTMSRFPLIVYCGYCAFFIEAPGRRATEAMLAAAPAPELVYPAPPAEPELTFWRCIRLAFRSLR